MGQINKKEGLRRAYLVVAYIWSVSFLTATVTASGFAVYNGEPLYFIPLALLFGLAIGPGLPWLLWRAGIYVYDGSVGKESD